MDTLVGWSVIDDGKLAVRTQSNDEKDFVIHATNLASLWCERQTATQILKRCEDLNPLIETTADNLTQHLRSLLNNDSLKKVSPSEASETIILKLKSTLDNFPFIWEYHLTLQSPDQFCQVITFPLLAMLRETSCVQEELCNIIRSKDKQIDDYKATGAAVSRRHLQTKDFNEEQYFASRTWRTVDDSIKESIPVLFCRDIDNFKILYSVVVERQAQSLCKKTNSTGASNADSLAKSAEGNSNPGEKDVQITESTSKKSEMNRLDVIRKRLREEESNEIAKQANRKPIIKRR